MKITELNSPSCNLRNLGNLNIIMGRNGSGKSRFLRSLDQALSKSAEFNIRYVSPERAGTFSKDGSVITNMENDPDWLRNVRAVNQATNFKPASAALLRDLETLYLRKLTNTPEIRNDHSRDFKADRLGKINGLLTNISIEQERSDFIFKGSDGSRVNPRDISSGESEAVSLATEILYFFDTIDLAKFNVLLLDEPDVHLHPDLQARLAKLIIAMLDSNVNSLEQIAICVSTHSAPFVCAVAASNYTSIGTKNFDVEDVTLKKAPEELRKIGPFFGHPLSLTLNEDIPLIVEGEDDERVWQQAARSSKGRIKLFPILATSVDQQSDLEQFSVQLLNTLYDDPVAFSVRDGDGIEDQPLTHIPPLKRYRLNCYAIENVLITDQCLEVMETTWNDYTTLVQTWLTQNSSHKDAALMRELLTSPDRLRHKKIKCLRQLICTVANCRKPWEVVVGQALGTLELSAMDGKNMLVSFIGETAIQALIFNGNG